MGTSTDYAAPPSWGPLKSNITRAASHSISATKAGEFLRDHIRNNGGSRQIASGGGVLGSSQTSTSVARSFGEFISQVAVGGLAEALRQSGLQDLVGKSAHEVLLGIVSLCGGTDGSSDAVDARSALSRLMDELCADAETADDVERVLQAQADSAALGVLMMAFFGFYLYEQFCRVFFKQLIQKHGETKAESFLRSILDFVRSALRNRVLGLDLSQVDWFGQQGSRIAETVMQQTLTVFER